MLDWVVQHQISGKELRGRVIAPAKYNKEKANTH
jgi:hypothetical protein